MGWWQQNEKGESFQTGAGWWGDGPADLVDAALEAIIEEFARQWKRLPTEQEIRAGLEFSLRGLPDRLEQAQVTQLEDV